MGAGIQKSFKSLDVRQICYSIVVAIDKIPSQLILFGAIANKSKQALCSTWIDLFNLLSQLGHVAVEIELRVIVEIDPVIGIQLHEL